MIARLCEDVDKWGRYVLDQWGEDIARIEPHAGGVAYDEWSEHVNGLSQSVVSVWERGDLASEHAVRSSGHQR